jgi:tetratricopeptide (TPR) repeat protein
MAISVTCSCNKQLRLKEIFAGKRVKCPACGKGLAVPGKANGKPANGTPALAEEESAFDFSTLMDDGPAKGKAGGEPAPKEVLPPVSKEEAAPPINDQAKTAVSVKDEDQPPAPGAGSVSPSPDKLAAPQVKRRLVAVLAGSFVVLAGLIVGLVLLIKNLDSSGPGTGDDPNGEYTGSGNKGPKLSAEEEERQRAQSQFRQKATGGGNGNKAAIEAAKRKKAEADKLKRQQEEEANRVAAAKKKEADDQRERERIADAKRKKEQAEEAKRKAAEAEKLRLAQLEKEKKKTVAKLILDGETALAAKNYEKAAQSLDQASKLAPDNEEIKRNLAKAQKELTKRQFAKLVLSGKDSLKKKDYQKAFADLTAAQKLFPEDKEAARALKQAQAGLDKEARKKARAEADAYVKNGKKLLKDKKYAEAHQQFSLAAKLFPNDPTIERLVKSAAERLKKQQERAALLAKQRAKKDADELVNKGRKALANKEYEQAVTALTRAQQLAPSPSTLSLLKKAEKGLKELLLARAAEQKEKEEARRAEQLRKRLKDAKLALAAKPQRLDEAEKLLLEALKLSPNDPEIQGLLKEVKAAKKAIQDENDRKIAKARAKAEEARMKRHAKFQKKMTAGTSSLNGKKFDQAITDFMGALDIVRNYKEDAALTARAQKAIKDAQDAKEKDRKLRLKLSR